MAEWLLVVTVLMKEAAQPDWVMPMASEAECLQAAAEWPKWRKTYETPADFLTFREDATCQQRADYEWSLNRGDGDGVWEEERGR